MKTKEELLAMSHEELADYAMALQSKSYLYDTGKKDSDRMKKVLSSIRLICETCDTQSR